MTEIIAGLRSGVPAVANPNDAIYGIYALQTSGAWHVSQIKEN